MTKSASESRGNPSSEQRIKETKPWLTNTRVRLTGVSFIQRFYCLHLFVELLSGVDWQLLGPGHETVFHDLLDGLVSELLVNDLHHTTQIRFALREILEKLKQQQKQKENYVN